MGRLLFSTHHSFGSVSCDTYNDFTTFSRSLGFVVCFHFSLVLKVSSWRCNHLTYILAAQALLCFLKGYLFLNLAFAMRRNCSICLIVICCEWFVASLCAVGSHRTLYGKGGRPPSSSLSYLWTYCLHYLYSLCGVCRWLLPHIPRKE